MTFFLDVNGNYFSDIYSLHEIWKILLRAVSEGQAIGSFESIYEWIWWGIKLEPAETKTKLSVVTKSLENLRMRTGLLATQLQRWQRLLLYRRAEFVGELCLNELEWWGCWGVQELISCGRSRTYSVQYSLHKFWERWEETRSVSIATLMKGYRAVLWYAVVIQKTRCRIAVVTLLLCSRLSGIFFDT